LAAPFSLLTHFSEILWPPSYRAQHLRIAEQSSIPLPKIQSHSTAILLAHGSISASNTQERVHERSTGELAASIFSLQFTFLAAVSRKANHMVAQDQGIIID
jgi:hypothetical protein